MLKGGIIGLGIKGTGYIKLISQDPRTEVAGIYDIDGEKVKRLAKEYNLKGFNSSREMFEKAELDFVYIGTPDFAHTEYVLEAAEYGVDILVEKPMATELDEAKKIAKVIKEKDVKLQVAFSNRFNQPFIRARQAIEKGELGEILSINTRLNDTIYVPTEMLGWVDRSSPAWFLMSHTMDMASWLKQKRAETVYATGVKQHLVKKGIDTYDAIQASVVYEDGTQGFFESQWALPDGAPMVFDFKFDIAGTKASISIDTQDQMFHIIDEKSYKYRGTMDMEVNGRMLGQTAFTYQAFVDALVEGIAPSPSVEAGLENVKLLTAVHESIEKNQIIKID
ncbi:MAG: Gfo/Idh/MocA family protein [Halanaerobiales bacterium]